MEQEFKFFMKEDFSQYKDEWVAISQNKVIASGKTAKEVFNKAKKQQPKTTPFITKVRGNEAMLF
ncbi:MAG: hypothetical protein GXP63_00605 [DPANN group archaeon]|nr:hypothetical protein [DPANN group archaeon]